MPPVSEAQRRAMRAAESGDSTLGIPKSVGKEFSEADPGGKLPEKKRTDAPEGSRTSAGFLGGTLPKQGRGDQTPTGAPAIPPQPGGAMKSATFDHDLKGYMDSVKRGDAEGMARRAASWRK